MERDLAAEVRRPAKLAHLRGPQCRGGGRYIRAPRGYRYKGDPKRRAAHPRWMGAHVTACVLQGAGGRPSQQSLALDDAAVRRLGRARRMHFVYGVLAAICAAVERCVRIGAQVGGAGGRACHNHVIRQPCAIPEAKPTGE